MAPYVDEISEMQDFFVAAYAHRIPLDIVRANDVEKIKQVFAEYTEGWDDEKFIETESLISGIEYATLSSTEHSASVEHIQVQSSLDFHFFLTFELSKLLFSFSFSPFYFFAFRRLSKSSTVR